MKQRDYKLDFLRVMSMFMVVIIHVANCYTRNYSNITNFSYLGSIIFNVISRISVPIFFMISGALLANREFDKKKYISRIKKFIIIIIFWDIIYLVWEYFFLGVKYNNLYKLLFEPYRKHLWFLYAITLIYIIQPIISYIIRKSNSLIKILIIILWFIICNIGFFYFKSSSVISNICYIGYFILGNILYNNSAYKKLKKYNLLLLFISIICIVLNIVLSYKISLNHNTFVKTLLAYKCPLIIISSSLIYIYILNNYVPKKVNLILKISEVSFGVYLIHGIFLDIIKKVFNLYGINSFIGIIVFSVIIFLLSYLSIIIIKKTKLSKYIM